MALRTRTTDEIKDRLRTRTIETQSWGYVSTGTRFKVFNTPGTPRDVWEKIDDAATVHQFTGVAPTVALHIPWDRVDDYRQLPPYAAERGIAIGSISPNLFQEDQYRFGSLTNQDPGIRRAALDHVAECIDIMRQTGSRQLSLWLADGSNYPGQADFRARRRRLIDGMAQIHDQLAPGMVMLLEYKFFEPAFYHTDVQDWGQSLTMCRHAGDRAKVLVDLGHHALGANIEHIVASLLDEGRLGGFDLNSKKYGDDDLFVGAINPLELFLIVAELIAAEDDPDTTIAATAAEVLYKIDQCAMVEDKIPAMIRSVTAMQTAFAKALLVDGDALQDAQREGDVVGANTVLNDAFETDVRPLLGQVRAELGIDVDPLRAYLASGQQQQRAETRLGEPAGW